MPFRPSRFLTFEGQTLCLMDWGKKTGLGHGTIKDRLRRGWSIPDALSKPIPEVRPKTRRHRKQSYDWVGHHGNSYAYKEMGCRCEDCNQWNLEQSRYDRYKRGSPKWWRLGYRGRYWMAILSPSQRKSLMMEKST